ncbi:MAG: M20/M25/M40 family metallo-hydrolase [Flavobacteriales bacterium AspAUS03]
MITTEGSILLGADDKTGIAEIITAIERFKNQPKILQGPITIAFTHDEEINH